MDTTTSTNREPKNNKVCVVMPTVRNPGAIQDYIRNARNQGFPLERLHTVLVTEDFCDTNSMRRKLENEGVEGNVFDESDRESWMENNGVSEYNHLIPEKSHAQTSFGLLYTWRNGYEYCVFLDDDTKPLGDFFNRHIKNLRFQGEIRAISSSSGWVNVLHQNFGEHGLYPRGYPYSAMNEEIETTTVDVEEVVASQGLWTGIPDLDAVRILNDGDLNGLANTCLSQKDYGSNFVATQDNYLTLCSMNLAFRREVIPAFYQLPMDDNPWGVGRFDDIWSGVFLKRACDILDKHIVNGVPLCRHDKAPRSTFQDLASEAPALELNEHLSELIRGVGSGRNSYAGIYREIANKLRNAELDAMNSEFLEYMGEHMLDWLDCLDELAKKERVPAND